MNSRMALFYDRADAGRQLATYLMEYAQGRDPIVLALPRGGVPVGYEVAEALGAPLDVYTFANSAYRGTKSSRWARLLRTAAT